MFIFFLSQASSIIPGEEDAMSFAKWLSSGKSIGGRTHAHFEGFL